MVVEVRVEETQGEGDGNVHGSWTERGGGRVSSMSLHGYMGEVGDKEREVGPDGFTNLITRGG